MSVTKYDLNTEHYFKLLGLNTVNKTTINVWLSYMRVAVHQSISPCLNSGIKFCEIKLHLVA